MASNTSNTEILIKRSLSTDTPSLLNQGELAYSYSSNTLFIGTPGSDGAIEIGAWSNVSPALVAGGHEGITYGNTTTIPSVTIDQHGKVIAVSNNTISTTLQLDSDNGSNSMSLLTGTLKFTGGDGVTTTVVDGSANVLIEVDDTIIRANGTGGSTNQTIDGVLNVSGSLNVSGNISYTNVDTIISQNSLIKLANNNISSDVVDIGFYGESNNGTGVVYTGLFRHAGGAGKDYYLFDGYNKADPDATFVIDPSDPSFSVSTLHANLISGSVHSGKFLADESSDTNGGYGFYQDGAQDTGMYSSGDGNLEFKSNGGNNFTITDGTFTHHTNVTLQYGATLGDNSSNAVFFGNGAGTTGNNTVSIGGLAGQTNQGTSAVAVGHEAGQTNQSSFAVSVGLNAGQTSQGTAGVAIGHVAGQTSQGQDAVAVGVGAGINSQGQSAVAVGNRAGAGYTTPQGEYSVAIGASAGYQSQAAYSIAINASGNALNPTEAGLYIDPIRNDVAGGNVTAYNTSTKELVNTNVKIDNNGITLANGTNITDGESGLFVDSLNFGETTNVVFYNTTTKEVTYGSMADLRPDRIENGSYYWEVDASTGALFSDQGTYIADKSNSVVIGQGVDVTSSVEGRVAIGRSAGNVNQGSKSVAIGDSAGANNQSSFSVAVGLNAGQTNQNNSAVAIGHVAGELNQGNDSVAIGVGAGLNTQGSYAVAIGERAGYGSVTSQGNYSVLIGSRSGYSNAAQNSIVLNASGSELNSSESGLYINPVRYTAAQDAVYDGLMFYNESTKEVRYSYTLDGGTF